MTVKIPIEYIAFFNHSGYSIAAQNYILSLYRSKRYNINIKPLGNKISKKSISKQRYDIFKSLKSNSNTKDKIQIYHCIPTIQKRTKKVDKNIGFATFETYNPPQKWIDILNKNNGLITPSEFNYNIFAHSRLKKPLFHISHCIDFDLYDNIKPLFKNNKFKFLFIGRWKERKGYKTLIEAFLNEFNQNDSVELYIKTDKVDKAKAFVHKMKKVFKNSKGFASIFFESQVYNNEELLSFIKSFDCMILPTMGEGFCIPGLQCMALNIPVIITQFSGCTDYAKDETCFCLKPKGFVMKRNMDSIPQFSNKKWAYIDVKQIRRNMRNVIEDKINVEKKISRAYEFVNKNFNYKITEQKFRKMLGTLYNV